MADYKVTEHIELTGPYLRQLNEMARLFERNEGLVKTFQRTLSGSVHALQSISSQAKLISKELHSLGGIKVDENFAKISKHLAPFLKDMSAIKGATTAVANEAALVSGHFESTRSHVRGLLADVNALKRDLAGLRMPSGGGGGRSIRHGGSGGYGGSGGHSGGSHGFGSHEVRGIVGTYNAAGLPTGSLHTVAEALKEAGSVDQIAQIQIAQGAVEQGRALSRTLLLQQVEKNKQAAYAIAKAMPYTDPAENMRTITDLADLGKGDYAQARALAPQFARMSTIAGIIGTPDVTARLHQEGQTRFMARGLSQMGVMAKTPEEQQQYFDALLRGSVATRGIFDGRQFFGAVAKSGGTATGWSADFIGGALPILAEEMGGSGAGDAAYMFSKHLLKGQMSNIAESDELIKLGLQKEGNLKNKKDFNAGSILGADLLKSDIFRWFDEIFVPALTKKGVTSKEGIDEAIDNLTFAKNYGKMFHTFNENRENIKADMLRSHNQGSLDSLITNTMSGQLVTLTQSAKTLATAVADPQVASAITILKDLGGAISSFAASIHENPTMAKTLFGAGIGVAGGVAAAGAVGLTIAAVGALSLPSLAIGAGATVTILGALIPWKEIFGIGPGDLAKGFEKMAQPGYNPDGKMPDLFKSPGGSTVEMNKLKEGAGSIWDSITGGASKLIHGFGEMAKEAEGGQKKVAEGAKEITAATPPAKSWLDSLGNSLIDLAKKAMMSEAVIGSISFNGGSGGGFGGAGIVNASFSPGNDNFGATSGVARALSRGGLGAGGSIPGVPLSVQMSDAERNTLGLIQKYESGGRNAPNYRFDRGHTAQGYYQITNSNWHRIAPLLGITAPNAMAASLEDQTRVAHYLLHHSGVQNWSNFNRPLRGALSRGEHAPAGSQPPTAGPPPKGQMVEMHSHTYLDGKKIATTVTKHIAKAGRYPGSTGGPDTYGNHHGPATHLTDVA